MESDILDAGFNRVHCLADAPTLMALGMAGFLATVTQAPMTAFIIVMEMVDGHALVLSLMASALVASGVSRLISALLYASLAQWQLQGVPQVSELKKGAPKGSKLVLLILPLETRTTLILYFVKCNLVNRAFSCSAGLASCAGSVGRRL